MIRSLSALLVTAAVAVTPTAASAGPPLSTIAWATCPAYSDAALDAMVPPERREKFEQVLTRLECGTIRVPLDHDDPYGRSISVAVTRIRATDPGHRLGSVALNPGGPGGSGYLLPVQVLTMGTADGVNDRYDLIGFDPRGVGYSTSTDCPPPAGEGSEDPVGPLTEAQAREIYDREVRANAVCGRTDPAFLAHLTTFDVARDLDRIRAALGERTLSYLGVSWGTWLGVVYRDLFPHSVGRMFLDSVAIPRFNVQAFLDGRAAAAERNAGRFAAWIAERHDTYGLGTSAAQVREAIAALGDDYDANPRRFTDLPIPLDGAFVAVAASQDSPIWNLAAQVLTELRSATGPTAPPTVKQVVNVPADDPAEPPADLPEQANLTMNHAVFCNEDPSRLGFDQAWASYQQRLADNPLTGRNGGFGAACAGWPLPVRTIRLHPGSSSVVLSGHRYETPSPYEWTLDTRDLVGGKIYTVDDDVHGSVMQEPACAADVVDYFLTGRIDGGCPGVTTTASTASSRSSAASSRSFAAASRSFAAASAAGWSVAGPV